VKKYCGENSDTGSLLGVGHGRVTVPFYFKPLRRLLSMYIQETTGEVKDLSDISVLFDVLQNNTHIVAQYFDIRTQNYFHDVMSPAFVHP
jgi:hypothetical protein